MPKLADPEVPREGQIKMAQDAIGQYLEARFGLESRSLQENVRAMTDLEAFSQIMNRIFLANSFDEAKAIIIIQDVLRA